MRHIHSFVCASFYRGYELFTYGQGSVLRDAFFYRFKCHFAPNDDGVDGMDYSDYIGV